MRKVDVRFSYSYAQIARVNPHLHFPTIQVKIMDINDHYPIFDSVSYEISIPENTSPGTDIISVSATDADDGDFGDITYKIA